MKKLFLFLMLIASTGAYADIATDVYVDRITKSLESTVNKVTAITVTATDVQYPSALAVKTALDAKVSTTGDETVGGVKTFSASPIVPSPTLPSAV